jgi:hypothetical protein
LQQVAVQNKLSARIPIIYGLEAKKKVIASVFIGSPLFLAWLTGRTNGK